MVSANPQLARWRAISVLVATVLTVFFSSVASADETPTLGVAVPTSGEYADLGEQVVRSAKMAAGDVGISVVVADTKASPVGAMKAVRELASRPDVIAILGPLGHRESRAAAGAAQRAGVPLFSFAGAPSVNRAGHWVFRIRQSPEERATQLARVAYRQLDLETVGILFPENDSGSGAALAFARAFEEAGGRVTAVSSYPESTTDFRKPLGALVGTRIAVGPGERVGKRRADSDGYLRVRSKTTVDFEGLFVPDHHKRVAKLVSFLPVANIQNGAGGDGLAVQLLGMPGWQGPSMRHTGAKAAGAIYPDVYAGRAEGGRAGEFARVFEAETGRRPVDLDAQVFDAAWLVATLNRDIARRQSRRKTDPTLDELRSALVDELPREKPFVGVAGALRFGARGEPLRELKLFEFDVDGAVSPWN